jgi:hypothetical protein
MERDDPSVGLLDMSIATKRRQFYDSGVLPRHWPPSVQCGLSAYDRFGRRQGRVGEIDDLPDTAHIGEQAQRLVGALS